MQNSMGYNMMSWINVILAAYLLYSAVTGKGAMFKTDHLKKEMVNQYKKLTRIFCIVAGLIMAGNAVIDFVSPGNTTISLILIGAVLVVIVVFVVTTYPMIEGRKKR